MKNVMQRSKTITLVTACYFGACFLTAEVLYGLSILHAPPIFSLAPTTWLASFLFVGVFTAICCAGGLLGIWFIIVSTDSSVRDHMKTAMLIGVVSSGILAAHSTGGSDRIMLGATFVAVLSVVIALIVKTHSRGHELTLTDAVD